MKKKIEAEGNEHRFMGCPDLGAHNCPARFWETGPLSVSQGTEIRRFFQEYVYKDAPDLT